MSDLVVRQLHIHSKTCKKRGQKVCRFNFPQPPMRNTAILYPLGDELSANKKEKYKEKFKKLNEKLNNVTDGEDMSLDDFLERSELSEKEYNL